MLFVQCICACYELARLAAATRSGELGGVVGMDLAGDELHYNNSAGDVEACLRYAKEELHLNTTVHAGEMAGPQDVRSALTLMRADRDGVDMARDLAKYAHDAGRPCAPGPSLTLCAELLKARMHLDAANVVLQMGQIHQRQSWAYSVLARRLRKLARAATGMPEDSEARLDIEKAVHTLRERYSLYDAPPDASPTAAPSDGEAAAAAGEGADVDAAAKKPDTPE